MNIKVHRGLEQIGGCITEISTATSRVFIDFGQNLPGHGEPTTPEQDKLMVENIFASNAKSHEAVFYTHGHEDHVGLFE
jgi:ribonuclease J